MTAPTPQPDAERVQGEVTAAVLPAYAGRIRHIDSDPGTYAMSVMLDEIDHQRAAGWPDFHPEQFCHRCGNPNASWWTAAETWNPVMRGGDPGGWGPWQEIVCIPCFIEVAEHLHGAASWRVTRDENGSEVLVRLGGAA